MNRPDSYRSLLNIPGLPPLLVAAIFSRLAGRMFVLTLVLFVLARFSSPEWAGWLTFAAIAPGLIVSPLAGAILDRVGPTAAVGIDFVASAVFVAAVGVAGWAGSATHRSRPMRRPASRTLPPRRRALTAHRETARAPPSSCGSPRPAAASRASRRSRSRRTPSPGRRRPSGHRPARRSRTRSGRPRECARAPRPCRPASS